MWMLIGEVIAAEGSVVFPLVIGNCPAVREPYGMRVCQVMAVIFGQYLGVDLYARSIAFDGRLFKS